MYGGGVTILRISRHPNIRDQAVSSERMSSRMPAAQPAREQHDYNDMSIAIPMPGCMRSKM